MAGAGPGSMIVALLTTFVAIGFLIGAGVIALDEFSGAATTNKSKWAINNTTEGIANFAEQLPTVGTLLGIALLLMVVTAAFIYFRGWV